MLKLIQTLIKHWEKRKKRNDLPEADPSISRRTWNPRRRQDLWCFLAPSSSPDAVYPATVSISRTDRWWHSAPSLVNPCNSPPSPRERFVRSRIAVWTSIGRGCLCCSPSRDFSPVPFSHCSLFQPCPAVRSRCSTWPRRKASGQVYLWLIKEQDRISFFSYNFILTFLQRSI